MAEATLNDVNQKLSSQLKVDEVIARGVNGLRDEFKKLYGLQEKLLRQMAEAAREGGTPSGGGGADGVPSGEEAEKRINPFFAAAIVAAVAVFTAVKDYFRNLGKAIKGTFKAVSAVFKGFLKVSKIGEYAGDIAKSIRGSIKTAFAVMGRALKTLVPDLDPIKDSFKNVKAYFGRIRTAFSSGADDFLKFLTENSIFRILKNGFTSIKNFIFGGFSGDDVKGIKSFASGIIQRVSDFFKPIRTFFSADGPIAGVVKFLRGAFSFAAEGSGFIKMLTGIGRVIGRLAWPITVIMGLIDGISGFFEAYNVTEGGSIKKFMTGLLGGLAGIISGIFAMPIDLLKSAVSWIAGKLGFEDAEKYLDSFSFVDIVKNIIMSPLVMIKKAINFVLEMVAGAVESFSLIPGSGELAERIRGMKFDTSEDETYTETVARKKQEDVAAGEALDDYSKQEGRYTDKKFSNKKMAQIEAEKQGQSRLNVEQDNEGNWRVLTPKGAGLKRDERMAAKDVAPKDMTPPSKTMGGAPIFINDNSSQVSGGGTTLAGETRPSTANGQAEKTGFYRSSGGF